MELSDFIAALALVTSVVSITYTMVVDRRRPRLEVWGGIKVVIVPGVGKQGSYFSISATNHGPGRINVLGVALTRRNRLTRWYRRVVKKDGTQGLLVNTSPESPHTLPMWLEVGESLTLFYPKDGDYIVEENEMFDCFYVYDSLGGHHWSEKGVFKRARESLADDSGE